MNKAIRWLVCAALVVMMLPMSALTAGAEAGPLVEPTTGYDANFKLTGSPTNCPADYKFDSRGASTEPWIPEVGGTSTYTFKDVPSCADPTQKGDVTVSVTITASDAGQLVSFTVKGGKAGYVYVKGGPSGNLYNYTSLGGVKTDSGLHAPVGPSGYYYGVSHVSFCLCSDNKVKKSWEFTAPYDFAGRDYTYTAYYSEKDPAVGAEWVAVSLADGDADGVWTATTYHVDGTKLWWKWVVGGLAGPNEFGPFGPETLRLEATEPYVNKFALHLKSWTFTPPRLLASLYDLTVVAYYRAVGETDFKKVDLAIDAGGVFGAETVFGAKTDIEYYWEVSGTGKTVTGATYSYSTLGDLQTETIEGRTTKENALTDVETLKLWKVISPNRTPVGGAYWGAWSLSPSGPWERVALVEGPAGVWTGSTTLVDGMTIYYKFGDDVLESSVKSELITGEQMENIWEPKGATRTIGYWSTHPCMTRAVFTEKLGGSINIGWTSLRSIQQVMAILNYPQMSGAPRMSNFNKAKYQTSRQLAAAILNTGFGTAAPRINWKGTEMSIIEAARLALRIGNIDDIRYIGGVLDEFNNSGKDEWLPDWKPECWNAANPKLAVELGIAGWNSVKP